MSDEKKENSEETRTYSKAFEDFERKRFTDKNANLFFGLLDAMQDEFKEEQAEKYRNLFQAVDLIGDALKEVVKTEEGVDALKREINKRTK
tara:strand:- start:373 stop:645 length:273 start_codon:yes stop_codon:yes gene_type:complete